MSLLRIQTTVSPQTICLSYPQLEWKLRQKPTVKRTMNKARRKTRAQNLLWPLHPKRSAVVRSKQEKARSVRVNGDGLRKCSSNVNTYSLRKVDFFRPSWFPFVGCDHLHNIPIWCQRTTNKLKQGFSQQRRPLVLSGCRIRFYPSFIQASFVRVSHHPHLTDPIWLTGGPSGIFAPCLTPQIALLWQTPWRIYFRACFGV